MIGFGQWRAFHQHHSVVMSVMTHGYSSNIHLFDMWLAADTNLNNTAYGLQAWLPIVNKFSCENGEWNISFKRHIDSLAQHRGNPSALAMDLPHNHDNNNNDNNNIENYDINYKGQWTSWRQWNWSVGVPCIHKDLSMNWYQRQTWITFDWYNLNIITNVTCLY